jgi:uncharacterized membrane protein
MVVQVSKKLIALVDAVRTGSRPGVVCRRPLDQALAPSARPLAKPLVSVHLCNVSSRLVVPRTHQGRVHVSDDAAFDLEGGVGGIVGGSFIGFAMFIPSLWGYAWPR